MSQQLELLTLRLVTLPRLVRVIIVAFFALMVALNVSPLVDIVYLRFFFTAESVMLPALITVLCGCVMYMVGWYIYVGTVNTQPSAGKRILWYFVLGIIATSIVVVLILQGIVILNLPN